MALGSELGGDGERGRRWGGGLNYTQQVAVQCVVRVAAKHWASGLQGTVGGTVGKAEEEDELKQEGWHQFKDSLQTGPSRPALGSHTRTHRWPPL